MPVIYCSTKLATLIGNKRTLPTDKVTTINPVPDFNAHLFYIAGRKCVIFTNKATLYCLGRLDVSKKNLDDLSHFFQSSLVSQLEADKLFDTDEFWNPFFSEPVFCKTDNDKKVIGSINDFIHQLKAAMAYGNLRLDPTDTNAGTNVNTMIMGMIKNLTPLKSLTVLKQERAISPSN